MEIMAAFDLMLASLRAADASRRQVAGVLAWRDLVAMAVLARQACGQVEGPPPPEEGTRVATHDAATHRAWLHLCEQITSALKRQAHCATETHAQWGWAEQQRGHERDDWLDAAAAAEDDNGRAHCLAMAGKCEEARIRARAEMAAAAAWHTAAEDAAVSGQALAAHEDRIHRPAGEAVAAAGGLAEVATAKHYHVMEGGHR